MRRISVRSISARRGDDRLSSPASVATFGPEPTRAPPRPGRTPNPFGCSVVSFKIGRLSDVLCSSAPDCFSAIAPFPSRPMCAPSPRPVRLSARSPCAARVSASSLAPGRLSWRARIAPWQAQIAPALGWFSRPYSKYYYRAPYGDASHKIIGIVPRRELLGFPLRESSLQ